MKSVVPSSRASVKEGIKFRADQDKKSTQEVEKWVFSGAWTL